MRPSIAVAALMLAALPAAAPAFAQTDPVLARILAESAKAKPVAFERTVKAEVVGDKGSVVVDRFNPGGATGGQWTLVSIDGRKPTAKEIEDHRKATAQLPTPGFHRISKMFATPPVRRSEAQGRISYKWDSLPEGAVVTPGGDISKNLSAEMVVEPVAGTPQIASVRVFATQPFSIRSVAKMNMFDSASQYRPGQSGLPFLTAQTQSTDVSAPFGMGGKRRSQVSFKAL